jgi:hypothetical protein
LLANNAWSPAVFNAARPSHWTMIAAGVITMPVSLVALPVTYVLAAYVINGVGDGAVNANVGHTMGLWFALVAIGNAIVITMIVRYIQIRRENAALDATGTSTPSVAPAAPETTPRPT